MLCNPCAIPMRDSCAWALYWELDDSIIYCGKILLRWCRQRIWQRVSHLSGTNYLFTQRKNGIQNKHVYLCAQDIVVAGNRLKAAAPRVTWSRSAFNNRPLGFQLSIKQFFYSIPHSSSVLQKYCSVYDGKVAQIFHIIFSNIVWKKHFKPTSATLFLVCTYPV